jgi:hypothetical protein
MLVDIEGAVQNVATFFWFRSSAVPGSFLPLQFETLSPQPMRLTAYTEYTSAYDPSCIGLVYVVIGDCFRDKRCGLMSKGVSGIIKNYRV